MILVSDILRLVTLLLRDEQTLNTIVQDKEIVEMVASLRTVSDGSMVDVARVFSMFFKTDKSFFAIGNNTETLHWMIMYTRKFENNE